MMFAGQRDNTWVYAPNDAFALFDQRLSEIASSESNPQAL
jgi:hypothetical protein